MSSRTPLYPRLLRLRHIAPNAWQRALLGEGALAVAAVLVLADLATAWTLLALPLAVAVVVKVHDVLAGLLRSGSVPARQLQDQQAQQAQEQQAPDQQAQGQQVQGGQDRPAADAQQAGRAGTSPG